MTKILGLDPGKTTGYALIEVSDRTIYPLQVGNTKDMSLVEIRHLIDEADVIVYEGWRTFKKKARSGAFDFKTMPASEVIGSMNTLIRLRDPQKRCPEVHENLSAVKPVGYGYANMKYVPGKKGMHWQDAMAHAVYYAVDILHAQPVGVRN